MKKKKKEWKEEAAKLQGTTLVQHIADDHDASTSDAELLEEPNFGSSQSNLDEEQAVISDVNSNHVDDDTPAHTEGVHGPKKECSCHKMINSIEIKRHIRGAHMSDTRECPECKKQIRSSGFSRHMQVVHSGIKRWCPRCGKDMAFNNHCL